MVHFRFSCLTSQENTVHHWEQNSLYRVSRYSHSCGAGARLRPGSKNIICSLSFRAWHGIYLWSLPRIYGVIQREVTSRDAWLVFRAWLRKRRNLKINNEIITDLSWDTQWRSHIIGTYLGCSGVSWHLCIPPLIMTEKELFAITLFLLILSKFLEMSLNCKLSTVFGSLWLFHYSLKSSTWHLWKNK